MITLNILNQLSTTLPNQAWDWRSRRTLAWCTRGPGFSARHHKPTSYQITPVLTVSPSPPNLKLPVN